MDNKKLADVISSLGEKVKENSENVEQLRERVNRLENPGAHNNEDINDNLSNYSENTLLDVNNKLSNYAQKAAQDSRGLLKPDELLAHFTSNDFGKKKKEAMAIFRKFPNHIDEVKNQLSYILEDLETQLTRRKRENELDMQLIQRIRKFNETLEKEQGRGKNSNTKLKLEGTTDQSQKVTTRNKNKLLEAEITGKTHAAKQGTPVKQAGKRGRKRKLRNCDDEDDDSCSSQEIEVEQVTESWKFLKLNSPNSSQESIESDLAHESGAFNQHRQTNPVINSESSQSSLEEDSTETFETKKTSVKSTGKRSKQPECNGNEETVHEKQLSSKGKKIRRN